MIMAGYGKMSGRQDTGSKKKMTEMSDRSIAMRKSVYGGDSPSEKAKSSGSPVKGSMMTGGGFGTDEKGKTVDTTGMGKPKTASKAMAKSKSNMMPVSMPPKRPSDAPKMASKPKSDKSKDVAMNFGANAIRTRLMDK
jgi:hypothetical protein